MNKIILLLTVAILAHIHSIWLLQQNLKSGNWLKIVWAIAGFIWGIVLLHQAYVLFKNRMIKRREDLL